MKEKLIIKNFGPIKSVELDLGRFNVLIGEQATGKSTVAKVLAVCRYFSYIVNTGYNNIYIAGENFLLGIESWGLYEHLKYGSSIYYECRHYTIFFNYNLQTNRTWNPETEEEDSYEEPIADLVLTPTSDQFKALLEELNKIKPKALEGSFFQNMSWRIPSSFFLNDVANVMDNPLYIYTERGLQSLFSLGKNSVPNISDSLYNYFDKTSFIFSQSFKTETDIEPLDLVYMNENGKSLIKSKKHGFLSLSNASSGYQSAIPIVLSLKYYSEIKRKRKTFIIEEPELNLFPNAQQKLMEYLVESVMNYGNSILATTHSPYILTSLNNLMYAYKIGEVHPEETNKIIEKKYWLNPDEVSAYMMLPNGEYEDIFDRAESLIRADKIDGISGVLNQQFDSLMNIEFSQHAQNS